MHNIRLVVIHDIVTTLRQRSFWIFSIVILGIMLAINLSSSRRIEESEQKGTADSAQEQPTKLEDIPLIGLVDEANILSNTPPGLPENLFIRFTDQQVALTALRDGQVNQVVFITANFLSDGQVIVYDQDFQIRSSGEDMGFGYGSQFEWVLPYLINYNLTGDPQLVLALRNPTPGSLAGMHRLSPVTSADEINQALAEVVSSYVPYIYYFLIILSSGYLLRSVIAEKENRTAEVLLLSLHPRELMTGKIIAMSFVMIIQLIIWALGGMLFFNRNFSALDLSAFNFPPGFFLWAGVYLVLGYLLFAAVMAACGAIAGNPREVGQITIILIIPLLPTLMFGSYFVENPDSLLTIALSLFPFSAPGVMVTRLAFGPVPLWQLVGSLALLTLSAYVCFILAGRFFKVGNLLSLEAFNWNRMIKEWRVTTD